jgi:hypothetical protein
MALTPLQRRICRVLAELRKRHGESYVAGGVALNELLGGTRRSRDLDLFHDTEEALAATWPRDRDALTAAGFTVRALRVMPSFVEAHVGDASERELLQWAQDSAYRFFPLVEDETFGLTLHPFDLATNKVLALVGRRTIRDWVDAIRCHEAVQPLGYLAWAASGKDPGLSPPAIVEEAARTRYAQAEIDRLDFDGPTPRAADLSARWHAAVGEAREIVRALPAEHVGTCVLDDRGGLEKAPPGELPSELSGARVAFHEGRIRGAFPELRSERERGPRG